MRDFVPAESALARLLVSAKVTCLYCDGTDWYASPGLVELFGKPAVWSALADGVLEGRVHREDMARFEQAMHSPAALSQLNGKTVRFRHVTGAWHTFQWTATQEGHEAWVVLTNITEKRQMEAALIDSQLRLHSLYDAAPVAIILWSREGRITDWNRMAQQTLGYSRDSVIGQKLVPLLIVPDEYQRFSSSLTRALQDNNVSDAVCRTLTADGREITCEWYSVPLRSPQGGLMGIFSLALDVTEKLAAEEVLRRQKESAEALSQAKSEFIATISHEFLTPMNGILGMSEVLLHCVEEPENQEFVRAIHDSGKNLLSIINAILDYTQVDATRPEDSMAEFNLGELVHLWADRTSWQCQKLGVGFKTHQDESLLDPVVGDRRSVEMILKNLLDNAVKFTEKGEVEFRAEQQAHGAQTLVTFTLRDTGVGIPQSYLPMLFTPFKQAENAITRKFAGVGLGLALSKKLVDRLQGELTIESTEGQGTTVTLQLAFGCSAPGMPLSDS